MSMYDASGATRTLSAMFDTRAEADRAVAALKAAGIADIVLHGGENEGYGTGVERAHEDRGFFESLGDFFFPDEDRYTYAEGLNRGGYLVTVSNVAEADVNRALDILDREGSVDLDAREATWRESGWSYGTDSMAGDSMAGSAAYAARDTGLSGAAAMGVADRGMTSSREGAWDAADTNHDGKIDVVEERLSIQKREADLGRVRVRSYVREIPVEETVNLREERVNIERRPVDRAATDADFRDQSIEAREYAEKAVVNKEARVVEEINVSKEVTSRDEVVRDTLRKTEVEVEDERGVLRTDRDTGRTQTGTGSIGTDADRLRTDTLPGGRRDTDL